LYYKNAAENEDDIYYFKEKEEDIDEYIDNDGKNNIDCNDKPKDINKLKMSTNMNRDSKELSCEARLNVTI